MLLRRITQHVKDQNWIAICIDFVIVVMGVFIGIQVANWNEGRASKLDYVQALDRAEAEIAQNIEFIDAETDAISNSLATARAGFDTLLSCSNAADAADKINAGIVELRGTRSVKTRDATVIELTTDSALLSEQSDRVRKRFADLRFYQQLAVATSDRFEPITFEVWPSDSSALAIQPAEVFSANWLGIEYEVPRYALTLNVDVQQACTDPGLLNWFHTWESWQTNILVLNEKLRSEYQETLTMLRELRKERNG